MSDKLTRCDWAAHDILNQEYHDNEWGKPVHDDRTLFKMLILEGMQAGLSWITILKKRDAFIKAFDDFDPAIISTYGDEKIEERRNHPKPFKDQRGHHQRQGILRVV